MIIVSRWSSVCLSICLSVICKYVRLYLHFQTITSVNVNVFSPNLVCGLMLWRSGLGLLMGKYCQFLKELPARDMFIFLFLDDDLSKCQWSFTKHGALILWRSGLGLLLD